MMHAATTLITRWLPALILCALASTTVSSAEGPSLGTEFQVNTFVEGRQIRPVVGARADGGFIVVWQGPTPTEGARPGESAIVARRFDDVGAPLSDDTSVTVNATGPAFPRVAMADSGRFVVAWRELFGYEYGFGTSFDTKGDATSAVFSLETDVEAIAVNREGTFLTAWNDRQDPTMAASGSTVRNAHGALTGAVIGHGADTIAWDSAARPADGSLLVLWQTATTPEQLVLGRYDAQAQLQSELVVSTHPPDTVAAARLAVGRDSTTLVAWHRTDLEMLLTQRHDGTQTPLGPFVPIDTGGPFNPTIANAFDVAMSGTGESLVTWRHEARNPGLSFRVEGAMLDARGEQCGQPFTISTALSTELN